MSLLFLTQDQGMFLGPVAKVLGWILERLAHFIDLFGVTNTGLTIILFTFLVNTLMLPLTIKQYKYQKIQSSLAPELTRIQKKYKGKKDQASMLKQQQETQAVYQKYGTSPTSGCLPMLISLPILFALYRVIYHIPGYVDIYYDKYTQLSDALLKLPDIGTQMQDWVKSENISVMNGLQVAFDQWSKFNLTDVASQDYITIQNNMVEFLSQLKSADWDKFINAAVSFKGVADANALRNILETTRDAAYHMNGFLGVNIANNPSVNNITILLPICAAGFQFLQTKMMPQNNMNPDAPGAATMKSMNTVMPIMSGVFCLFLPIGVGLYWVAGSVYRIIQQFFLNQYMKKVDINDVIKKNIEKKNRKLERKGEKPLKIQEISKVKTSSVEADTTKNTSAKKKSEPSNYKRSDVSYSANNISANANLLKRKNEEKGEK